MLRLLTLAILKTPYTTMTTGQNGVADGVIHRALCVLLFLITVSMSASFRKIRASRANSVTTFMLTDTTGKFLMRSLHLGNGVRTESNRIVKR